MIAIEQFDHLGIRVTDAARAIAFYESIGFRLLKKVEHDAVVIMKNAAQIEINLILNGVDLTGGRNILMDVPDKHPGYTHVAFRVAHINPVIADLKQSGIRITQGPVTFGDGHVSVFVRDPDRNVLEFRARLSEAEAERIEGLTFYDPKG
jgi:lactoylglutathione lyase